MFSYMNEIDQYVSKDFTFQVCYMFFAVAQMNIIWAFFTLKDKLFICLFSKRSKRDYKVIFYPLKKLMTFFRNIQNYFREMRSNQKQFVIINLKSIRFYCKKDVSCMFRKMTKEVQVGNVKIGGGNPIVIQSMCNTDTRDVAATVKQILELEEAGCELVRVAILDMDAANAVEEIKKQIHIPLVADIHFDYKLALRVMELGIDKVRINPGNIGEESRIRQVVEKAKEKKIPIRIGVNSGSLEKDLVEKYGGVTPQGLVESALRHVEILEKYGFYNIVVSIKASDVVFSLEAYQLLSKAIDYPIHVGITEAGTVYSGTIKSAVGIGAILAAGIGDTLRVSLTGNPVEEIPAAKEILKSLGLRKFGIELISCPTCGRTQIDLISIANEVEKLCQGIDKDIKVAIMGCVVNGPGEAREADVGIAGGKGEGLLFKKGEIIKKIKEEELVSALMEEIKKY